MAKAKREWMTVSVEKVIVGDGMDSVATKDDVIVEINRNRPDPRGRNVPWAFMLRSGIEFLPKEGDMVYINRKI